MKDFDWTDEAIEKLKALHATGNSFGVIADEMGVSRASVAGKAHRMGLTRTIENGPRREKSRAHKTIYKHGPPKRKGSLNEVAQLSRLKGESKPIPLPPEPIEDQEIPMAQRCSLLDLTNETCRWPVGTPGTADFFFCGSPTADCDRGHPYCAGHAHIAFNGRPQRGAPFIPRRAA